jgi:hypothetical protein
MFKYLLLSLAFVTSAHAANLGSIQNPSTISTPNPTKSDIKGRMDDSSLQKARENIQFTDSNTLTKTVSSRSSNSSTQLKNLATNTGELVQKVEDDRLRKAKDHDDQINTIKDSVTDTYNRLKNLNEGRLGEETDPSFKNAFKCKDPTSCSKTSDVRVISKCDTKGGEMLRWDGHKWTCINIFAQTSAPSCTSYQWRKNVNGGQVCVDYIYEWRLASHTICDLNSKKKEEIYKCYKKKTTTDTNPVLARDSECNSKTKPESKTILCTSAWNETGWSECSRSCGGGSQYRTVTCPSGYSCAANVKPATTQSCNTQSCTTQWVTGKWSECGNIGDKICLDKNKKEYSCGNLTGKTRVVYCPDGFSCTGSKPSETTSC